MTVRWRSREGATHGSEDTAVLSLVPAVKRNQSQVICRRAGGRVDQIVVDHVVDAEFTP